MAEFQYRVAILTASDKGSRGERVDESGPLIQQIIENAGYQVGDYLILPDEQEQITDQLRRWSEGGQIDLILTTGGTGFSPRDCMPEATLAVADRLVPGIAEAMRAYSMQITPRAMLSRATSVICRSTLIINLPGSPKAVRETLEYLLPSLGHGLDILTSRASECARKD